MAKDDHNAALKKKPSKSKKSSADNAEFQIKKAEDYMKKKGTRIFVFSILVILGVVLMFVGTLTIFKAGA